MGSNNKTTAPAYPITSAKTGGLFGSSTTNMFGNSFTPTSFQKNLTKTSESGALNALKEYLNPNYDSEAFRQADDYYTNKMSGLLENNYLNPALQRGLLRGSTAQDIYRGFANDLATTEYERQQDYKNQQLQNLQAALLGYNTIYDISNGVTGLSQALANSVANYNAEIYKAQNSKGSGSSGLGSILGGLGSIANAGANAYGSWQDNQSSGVTNRYIV